MKSMRHKRISEGTHYNWNIVCTLLFLWWRLLITLFTIARFYKTELKQKLSICTVPGQGILNSRSLSRVDRIHNRLGRVVSGDIFSTLNPQHTQTKKQVYRYFILLFPRQINGDGDIVIGSKAGNDKNNILTML